MRAEDVEEAEKGTDLQDGGQNNPRNMAVRGPRLARQANFSGKGEDSEDGEKGKTTAGKALSKATEGLSVFIIELAVAIAFDVVGIALNFILPGLGGIITTLIVTPVGFLILFGLSFISGKKLTFRKAGISGICAIIEFIPVINALPALTFSVIASKISDVAGEVIKDVAPKS